MSDDLELATRPVQRTADTFDLDVPDGWQQGRGAYGGLTIAALVRAIEAFAATPDRSVRAINCELPGPTLVGQAQIRVEALRVGSAQSTLAANISQGGELCGHCVAVLGRPRAQGVGDFVELIAPQQRPWDEQTTLPVPDAIRFAKHFEFRSDGPFPMTGGPEARALGWVRARTAAAMSCSAYLAAMCDAWWPAPYARARMPYPAATVAFSMQVLGQPHVALGEPLMYRAHAYAQCQGYSVEQRELWSQDGVLLALNQQSFVVIK